MDTLAPAPSIRILIVDDHPNTAAMLARVLRKLEVPVQVLTAQSGEEAYSIIQEAPADILITDFMMPGMNGLELVEKIQGDHEPIHTILITAYDSPGLDITARRLRVKDYLVKPVQPEKVRAIVSQVVKNLHQTRKATTHTSPHVEEYKVLIADDKEDNVRLLETRLRSEGYQFIVAYDGEEVLEKARTEQPDLILLDINMPKKDGFQVLAEMREDPALEYIPVIVLTAARIDPSDIREGLNLGADDYITKPFDWRELAARVRTKLRVKRVEDALRRRNRELGLLPEIGQALSARRDVEELATVLLDRTVTSLKASNGAVIIFNADDTLLRKSHLPGDDDALQRPTLLTSGVLADVIANRTPELISNIATEPRWLPKVDLTARSVMLVPLLSQRRVLGVLMLYHPDTGFFGNEQLTLVQAIASQAAVIVENAQASAIEAQRVQQLVALNQLTQELGRFTRSSDLFDKISEVIQTALGYQAVSLWLVQPNDGLALHRIEGDLPPLPENVLERTPCKVSETGRPSLQANPMRELIANPRELPAESPLFYSVIAAPFFFGARAGGVLAAHATNHKAFTERDLVLIETLASQIATAMERIRLFESVEQEQHRMEAVLKAAADAILVTDGEGRVQLLNPAARLLFTDVEARLGQPLPRDKGYDLLVDVLASDTPDGASQETEVDWPDGRTFAAVVTPIEEGGRVALLHDVTHFKTIERLKNDFIATASHDLKNPITSVLGYTQLLEAGKMGPVTDQQKEFLSRIRHAAGQMFDLVRNVLELARMDVGARGMRAALDVSDLLVGVVHEFQAQAGMKEQTLTMDPLDGRPQVLGDPGQLRQVLRNLVGNAIKYTPNGGQVRVSAAIDGPDILLEVRDNGIGIPEEALPHLFEKFYRVEHESTKDIEGNGLGLAIVKSLVEQHQGKISVTSVLDEGTCFTVRLPLTTGLRGTAQ